MNLRQIINKQLGAFDVKKVLKHLLTFIEKGDTILDLGSGDGVFTHMLKKKGYQVTPVDVKERSTYVDVATTKYDGAHLPFKDNSFDVCILIAVLHHTPDPEVVLKEAIRVSKRIIILEDAVTNIFQRWYTYIIDSFFNHEWIAPHTNKTEEEWNQLFINLGIDLVKTEHEKSWLFLQNPIFFLKKHI